MRGPASKERWPLFRFNTNMETHNIDIHDYEVKQRSMHRFFEEGDKVKVTLRFRGRELAHPELGMKLLQQVKADFDPVAKVEYEPRMEGRQMIMILAPR